MNNKNCLWEIRRFADLLSNSQYSLINFQFSPIARKKTQICAFVFSSVPLVFRSRYRWASRSYKRHLPPDRLYWTVPVVPSVNAITFELQGAEPLIDRIGEYRRFEKAVFGKCLSRASKFS